LQPRELYRTQQYATAIYRSELATELMALGYEIERGASGQPEIRGYTPDYLEASSPRRRQIETLLEREGRRGAAAAQIAAHKTREAKSHASHDEMRGRHRRLAQTFGEQPSRVVAKAHRRTTERSVGSSPNDEPSGGAARRHAVLYARDRNLERDAVPHERDYLRDALSRSMGRATVSVSNSLSGRQWKLDQVPAVGDPTHIVQIGRGHRVSTGEGQRRVALQ
jgi:hypothetical protein